MMARRTSLRGFEAAGLAVGALLAAACMPAEAAEFSARRDTAAPASSSDLCEPARWSGKAASATPVIQVAAQQDTGWWVVLATAPAEQDVQHIVHAMEACGLHPFNDFSGKFQGFRPGFNVVVDGAYASKSAAERVRSAALGCAPDAYLNWARYLGE